MKIGRPRNLTQSDSWAYATENKDVYDTGIKFIREDLFKAWDIHSKNVAYGVCQETPEEHEQCINWYNAICNKEAWAFVHIPECIRKHMRG